MLRPRKKLGKYRIVSHLARGGFANVYRAFDTIEGIHVALKIPHGYLIDDEILDLFRSEVRLTARLDHPNILPIKNASFLESLFVIVYPLGEGTLEDRLRSRRSIRTSVLLTEQMLASLAHAHEHRVIHCDVKPDNFILFPENRIRLSDFGIARVALRTVKASGSGTLGYFAPEQAHGRPTFRSDVFSLGLVLYQLLTNHLPEWPFSWPQPGFEILRRKVPPEMVDLLRRSLEVDERKRFEDARAMAAAFGRIRQKVLRHDAGRRRRRQEREGRGQTQRRDWQTVRVEQFRRLFGKTLETRSSCRHCGSPVSEPMTSCPWCAADRPVHEGGTRLPVECPRCHRGLKLDWRYCPWCYGPGFEHDATREYTDVRYCGRCDNPSCERKVLMPFMRYCPWCRRKVRRRWQIPDVREKCPRCGWGVLAEFWSCCPWCSKRLDR